MYLGRARVCVSEDVASKLIELSKCAFVDTPPKEGFTAYWHCGVVNSDPREAAKYVQDTRAAKQLPDEQWTLSCAGQHVDFVQYIPTKDYESRLAKKS